MARPTQIAMNACSRSRGSRRRRKRRARNPFDAYARRAVAVGTSAPRLARVALEQQRRGERRDARDHEVRGQPERDRDHRRDRAVAGSRCANRVHRGAASSAPAIEPRVIPASAAGMPTTITMNDHAEAIVDLDRLTPIAIKIVFASARTTPSSGGLRGWAPSAERNARPREMHSRDGSLSGSPSPGFASVTSRVCGTPRRASGRDRRADSARSRTGTPCCRPSPRLLAGRTGVHSVTQPECTSPRIEIARDTPSSIAAASRSPT